jgi:5-methylcytosine-specific restriction enzyme subunit McrC
MGEFQVAMSGGFWVAAGAKNEENKKILSDILFLLDEVTEQSVTIADCNRIKINPFFDDMNTVLDYCKMFLANSVSYAYKNELRVFAFLLPMEYVFEDFIFGFLDSHLDKLKEIKNLKSQKSDLYLAKLFHGHNLIDDKVFKLKHDIYFEYRNRKIILDAKYKLTYDESDTKGPNDNKHGVSQGDLYQGISYAIRRKSDHIFLIYPMSLKYQKEHLNSDELLIRFVIRDEFSNQDINVDIMKVPIIHIDFPNIQKQKSLRDNFQLIEEVLLEAFKKRFDQIQ